MIKTIWMIKILQIETTLMIKIDSKVRKGKTEWYLLNFDILPPPPSPLPHNPEISQMSEFESILVSFGRKTFLFISDHKDPVTAIIILKSTTHLRP